MRKLLTGFTCYLLSFTSSGQINQEEYNYIVDKAYSLYEAKNYQEAATMYSKAFRGIGKKAWNQDRVRAAGSWYRSGNIDSALYQLICIANSEILKYADVDEIFEMEALTPLQNDSHWENIRKQFFFQAYKNLLAEQSGLNNEIVLAKEDSTLAIALGEHSENAFSHLNDPAYVLLKKKMFDKAYRFFRAAVESFEPHYIFYQNMMDHYKGIDDKSRAYIYFSKAEVIKYKQSAIISDTSLQFDSAIKKEYDDFSKMIGQDFLPPEYLVKMVANAVFRKGMKEKAYLLLKMNLENYPNSFRTNKEMGLYYENTGDKQKANEYIRRSLILQYKLPDIFFD